MELFERIIRTRRHAAKSQSELARDLKVTPQAVQGWEKPKQQGGSEPRRENLVKIAKECQVDPGWLATGQGVMLPTEGNYTVSNLPAERIELIEIIVGMSESEYESMLMLATAVKILSKEQAKKLNSDKTLYSA